MLKSLKREVLEANLLLPKHGLVLFTWGNVSGLDREKGLMAIKPSGVEYSNLTPDEMVVVELDTGKTVEGKLNPSSDYKTHLELYKSFSKIGGIVHTHSKWATVFAQSMLQIPPLGTTHADYFRGAIPCTRDHLSEEIITDYELATGRIIVECFLETGIDPNDVPAVLVARHGPFTWAENALSAVENAVVLETVADMAWHSLAFKNTQFESMPIPLLEKHHARKHGKNAYYGQK